MHDLIRENRLYRNLFVTAGVLGLALAMLVWTPWAGAQTTSPGSEGDSYTTADYRWWSIELPFDPPPAPPVPPNTAPVTEDLPDYIVGKVCDLVVVQNESVWKDNVAYVNGHATPPNFEAVPNVDYTVATDVLMGSTITLAVDINTTGGPTTENGAWVRNFSSWSARAENCVTPNVPEPPPVTVPPEVVDVPPPATPTPNVPAPPAPTPVQVTAVPYTG